MEYGGVSMEYGGVPVEYWSIGVSPFPPWFQLFSSIFFSSKNSALVPLKNRSKNEVRQNGISTVGNTFKDSKIIVQLRIAHAHTNKTPF